MTRFIIEHRSRGAYLGCAPHPRSGKSAPLFRADRSNLPAIMFGSIPQAEAERDLFDDKLAAVCDIKPL
jgi:hypothetical protein